MREEEAGPGEATTANVPQAIPAAAEGSTETEHRSVDTSRADSQGKGGGKPTIRDALGEYGSPDQGTPRAVVFLTREKGQRKPWITPWPQTDLFAPIPVNTRVEEAWVVECGSVQQAQDQAEAWPRMLEGCRIIKHYARGKWYVTRR